jgi:hypothetical protein
MKRKKQQANKSYPSATKGEALYRYLRMQLDFEGSLNSSTSWLAQFSRSLDWCTYIEEFMAINLAGQLIEGGRFLRSRFEDSTVFESQYRAFLREHLYLGPTSNDRLFRLSKDAVDASFEEISDGTRKALTRWAKDNHPNCYLCGRMMSFGTHECNLAYTLDHVWPRDFGGDSTAENLLPACKECNGKHKANNATWAMTNIQSILLGFEPSESKIKRITGSSRFAIYHRHVQHIAVDRQLTLKEAYMRVGSSENVRVIDPLEFGHFFNLANHNSIQ